MTRLLSAIALLAIGCGVVVHAAEANRVQLFNGRDLTGWRLFLGEQKAEAGAATVADGVIRLASKASGYLVTEQAFADYKLHVEWRWPTDAAANANSGVLVHLNPPDVIWPVCVECQLKTGNAGQLVGMGQVDIPAAPMQNGRKRANRLADSSEKPFGQWNTYDITCRGDTIEVLVNGIRQNHIEKVSVRAGAIGLQLEGFPIEFRNVWLEKL